MTLITDNFAVTIVVILYTYFKTYYAIMAYILTFPLLYLFTKISGIDSCGVKFMCQLGWVIGHPETWSRIILGVSVRILLDKNNIKNGRL